MDSELLRRKLAKSFGQMDADGNGYIEESDLLALGAHVVAGFGHAAGSAQAQSVTDAFHRLWKALVGNLDADGDGRISPAEFQSGMAEAFTDQAAYDAFFQPAVDSILSLGDADGDGKLSLAEWRQIQAGYGTPPADAEATFRLLDSTGDGYLTRDELSTAVRQFYTGTDPEAPGNHLFGPLP